VIGILVSGLMAMAALAYPQPQRDVARIVSPEWSDEASRDRAGEARTVIRLVGIGPGQTVADIGAGSGYYTVRLSPVVGATGRVIAQDVTPQYLDGLKQRVRAARLQNVSFVLGTASDPRLPANTLDAALMIHMYHEIAQPYALLGRLRGSMKPDGRLAIVDLDRASAFHGMPKALLVCEVRSVGYDLVSMVDLTQGYLAIFKPGASPDPKTVKACRE
jgi:SAM-dependent methyltransferase